MFNHKSEIFNLMKSMTNYKKENISEQKSLAQNETD
jgi:hypothetical protein